MNDADAILENLKEQVRHNHQARELVDRLASMSEMFSTLTCDVLDRLVLDNPDALREAVDAVFQKSAGHDEIRRRAVDSWLHDFDEAPFEALRDDLDHALLHLLGWVDHIRQGHDALGAPPRDSPDEDDDIPF